MGKAVLISLQPRWCEKTACGDKSDELRKNFPKLEPPFKCYIYQTTAMWGYPILRKMGLTDLRNRLEKGKGMVIGEFICDQINEVTPSNEESISVTSCVTIAEMWEYARPKSMFDLKAWHISKLQIYDNPKTLSEFVVVGDCDCLNCKKCAWFDKGNGFNVEDDCNLAYENIRRKDPLKPIFKPPQSWCYVEELSSGNE